jgi:hypothetical protein
MISRPIVSILIGLLMIGVGAYMRSAPRRLFTRPGDSSEYRPQATELESDHGRFLTRTFPPVLIVFGLALIAYQLFSYLSE